MVWKFDDIDLSWDKQLNKADQLLDIESNLCLWCIYKLNIIPFDNQLEVMEAIVDLNTKYITLAATRSSGKSFSTALGLIKLCIDYPGFTVGVFAPKLEQATRLIKTCKDIIKASNIVEEINWIATTQSKLEFTNGSWMVGQSANEVSMTEGLHVDLVCCDESQKISDLSISQKILPMIASSRVSKVIKLGVALYKNHFWRSFNDQQYTQFKYDFTKCPNLLRSGSIVVKGKEYSKYVLDRMPLNIKQQMFPDNPELWNNTSDTTEIDFRTQYLIEWQEDLNLCLSDTDQTILASGQHKWLNTGLVTDTYFAGLDTAGGSPNGSATKDLDFTSLSIWRKTNNQTKEKVHHAEWRGEITSAINEIYELINPQNGKFKCQFTLVDYSNVGISLVESYKKLGLPIEGITFGSTEKSSGKNHKNAMMDQFLFELRAGRVKYPKDDIEKVSILKKNQNQWHLMERHKSLGINDKLCLAGGTSIPVLTDCNVEHLRLDEIIKLPSLENIQTLSLDLRSKLLRAGKILGIYPTGEKNTLRVHLSNDQHFDCTPDHKVLLATRIYREAQQLEPDDALYFVPTWNYVGEKRGQVIVTRVEPLGIQSVYDLTVDQYHNFALDAGVFVHNCVPESEGHDDGPMADLMGVWGADKFTTFLKGNAPSMSMSLPLPINVNSAANPQHNSTGKPWWLDGMGFKK